MSEPELNKLYPYLPSRDIFSEAKLLLIIGGVGVAVAFVFIVIWAIVRLFTVNTDSEQLIDDDVDARATRYRLAMKR